jgi:hypothetical protein
MSSAAVATAAPNGARANLLEEPTVIPYAGIVDVEVQG